MPAALGHDAVMGTQSASVSAPATVADGGSLCARILTPDGFLDGEIRWCQGRIDSIEGEPVAGDPGQGAAKGRSLLVPGFIDLHVHGGGGRDIMDGGDALHTVAGLHARHGTTAMLATTMTAPLDELQDALRAVAAAMEPRPIGSARVLGVHLEGPYLSPERLGAQPAHARRAVLDELVALQALAPIRLITLAPEEPGHLPLIPLLVARGIRVQIGHTQASYEQACAALQAGASGFTHLFNAMTPLQSRAPGVVGAALAHAEQAELIPDLLHVHPGAIRAALRSVPGLYAVTDATAAAGMPDGPYRLGRQTVHRCLGGVRLADGTLAGSALTMDQALRNLVSIGLPLQEACERLGRWPARMLGLQDRGVLRPGAWADAVLLDPTALTVQAVLVEGCWVPGP